MMAHKDMDSPDIEVHLRLTTKSNGDVVIEDDPVPDKLDELLNKISMLSLKVVELEGLLNMALDNEETGGGFRVTGRRKLC